MTASNAKPKSKVPAKAPRGPREGLKLAIQHFGSQGKLARALGVSQPSIAAAVLRGRLSEKLTESLHSVTGGELPKWSVRPDLFKRGGARR